VDGRFGPKTRKASAETLVSGGRSQVQETLALGGFQRRLAEAAGKPDGEGEVAKALSDTVSPLFMPGGRKAKPAAPSPWGVALQNSVKDLGGARLSPDGQVGRRTSRAVLDATRRAGPEALGKRFARNLGLLA
jgi:peptidoglycan hydrolase-like protein with peptidoglycan-binding domain